MAQITVLTPTVVLITTETITRIQIITDLTVTAEIITIIKTRCLVRRTTMAAHSAVVVVADLSVVVRLAVAAEEVAVDTSAVVDSLLGEINFVT